MDRDLLRSVIVRNGDTVTKLADEMGLSQSGLSQRMHGKVEFRQSEINFIRLRYHLTAEETERIFFSDIVSKLDTSA